MSPQKKCYVLCAAISLVTLVIIPWTTFPWPKTAIANNAIVGPVRLAVFSGALIAIASFLAGLGLDISRTPLGVLKSSRNTYSLSRLQMVLWTWLVLSALIAAAVSRAWGIGGIGDISTALAIKIPGNLLVAMGISYFTGFAAPAALALKSQPDTTASPAQLNLAASRLEERISATGSIIHRPSSSPARMSDLVQGDELANAGIIDVSKVQQLLITLLLVAIYLAMLCGVFYNGPFTATEAGKELTPLPDFSKDFLTLLTLSHAGYLGYKMAPKPAGGTSAVNSPTRRPLPPDSGAP